MGPIFSRVTKDWLSELTTWKELVLIFFFHQRVNSLQTFFSFILMKNSQIAQLFILPLILTRLKLLRTSDVSHPSMRPAGNPTGSARIWVACFLLVAWWWYWSLLSTLLSAVAVSLMAEQEHNGCEMYLEAGRMIYVMNHDKRHELTFFIITSLMQYKHSFLLQCWRLSNVMLYLKILQLCGRCGGDLQCHLLQLRHTYTQLLPHLLFFFPEIWVWSLFSGRCSLCLPQGCQVGPELCLGQSRSPPLPPCT